MNRDYKTTKAALVSAMSGESDFRTGKKFKETPKQESPVQQATRYIRATKTMNKLWRRFESACKTEKRDFKL